MSNFYSKLATGLLMLAALQGCSDACVRQSDCASGLSCTLGMCVMSTDDMDAGFVRRDSATTIPEFDGDINFDPDAYMDGTEGGMSEADADVVPDAETPAEDAMMSEADADLPPDGSIDEIDLGF